MLDQLNQIDSKLGGIGDEMIRVRSGLDTVQCTTAKCEKLLTGNGDPASGIVVRLDRAEQTIERQKKVGLILFTAVVGQLIERFFH